jgi:hypothetical protein
MDVNTPVIPDHQMADPDPVVHLLEVSTRVVVIENDPREGDPGLGFVSMCAYIFPFDG